jgi:rhodanese-related sulfurtransferase
MTDMPDHQLPKGKQTVLGLYVTAQEAYDMWKADPQGVNIVDVRTPEEYIFVGHPAMAKNIPLLFVKYAWDTAKNQPGVVPNPEFAPAVMRAFAPSDTLLMMCRSGGRSALAANGLAKAGFTNVYNITDGFEGDKVDDPDSAYHGKRMKNGWKNSLAPWTYEVDTDLLWLSE